MERLTYEQVLERTEKLKTSKIYASKEEYFAIDDIIQPMLELQKYKQLEEQIGCPLEVRCKLCDGTIIYDENGKPMGVEHIGEHDFYAYLIGKPYMPRLMYIKGYKKSWWLKADKSE